MLEMRWRDRYPRESTASPLPQQDGSAQPGSWFPGAVLLLCRGTVQRASLLQSSWYTVGKAVIPDAGTEGAPAPAQMLHSHSGSELGPH